MTRSIAWLIEQSTDGTILAGARWLRQPELGYGQWTTSANEAMRFDSKADAERYMVAHDITYARAIEHAWYPGTETAIHAEAELDSLRDEFFGHVGTDVV